MAYPIVIGSICLKSIKNKQMKPTNMKMYTLAIVSLILYVTGIAQNKTDEKAVKACLENYMSGEGDKVKKPFILP